MPGILFVCTANQFRSPIAAAYCSQRISTSASPETWKISSAGTWTTSGLPAHPEAIKAAAKLGLDLSSHQTLEIDAELILKHDLIVTMECNHKESLEIEFPQSVGRIVLLGQLAKTPGDEIPDPARSGFFNSDEVAALICASIQKTFAKLLQLTMLIHDGFSPINTLDFGKDGKQESSY